MKMKYEVIIFRHFFFSFSLIIEKLHVGCCRTNIFYLTFILDEVLCIIVSHVVQDIYLYGVVICTTVYVSFLNLLTLFHIECSKKGRYRQIVFVLVFTIIMVHKIHTRFSDYLMFYSTCYNKTVSSFQKF